MKFHYLLSLVAMLLPVYSLCAAQAPDAAAAAREALILECGISAFAEADDRLFGQYYRLPRNTYLRSEPDVRLRVGEREDEQIAICGRRHHLSAWELAVLDDYTKVEMLRRGAAWNLHDAGADLAKLNAIATTLSFDDITMNSNGALVRRLRGVLDEAGLPKPLHAVAVDYMVFVRRELVYRVMWVKLRIRPH